jgi:hypothetical protein
MKAIQLTEYRADGAYYPLIIFPCEGMTIREAQLLPNSPHIIGETKPLGKGARIAGLPGNQEFTVKDTPDEIYNRLNTMNMVVT